MPQYVKLGTFDLTDHIASEIKPSGGTWKAKQDGGVSLVTNAIKDTPSGASYAFKVVFDNDNDASDFLKYCFPYSPDSPDFDEDVGADLDLYVRNADWHLKVWSVMVVPTDQNNEPTDHTLYFYDVYCYLYSPYSEGKMQTWSDSSDKTLSEIAVTPGGVVYVLDMTGVLWTITGSYWAEFATQPTVTLSRIAANDNYILGIDASGNMYRYDGSWAVLTPGIIAYDISIASDDTIFMVGPYYSTYDSLYKYNGSSWTRIGSSFTACAGENSTECWIITKSNEQIEKVVIGTPHSWYTFNNTEMKRIAVASDGTVYGITALDDAVKLVYTTYWAWVSLEKSVKSVSCNTSGAWFVGIDDFAWEYTTAWAKFAQPDHSLTHTFNNTKGHIAGYPVVEITSSKAENITLAIDGTSLTVADATNVNEVWTVDGGTITEVYEDVIADDARWLIDWIGDGHYASETGTILIGAGESAYILLSGPNEVTRPITMTANLEAGNALDEIYIQLSANATDWTTAFDVSRFESGVAAYGLPAMGMGDVYVRINCVVGWIDIDYVKFEVKRKADPMPLISAGSTKTTTITATGGEITIDGSFSPKRNLI
ncbi:hypothetical protein M0R72_12330 [Candidatus Pacearchaeota archaeon]|jgi:hypothetical protein|nr:hypothetical protein [Candidatus Pacearchaeota archaeon]